VISDLRNSFTMNKSGPRPRRPRRTAPSRRRAPGPGLGGQHAPDGIACHYRRRRRRRTRRQAAVRRAPRPTAQHAEARSGACRSAPPHAEHACVPRLRSTDGAMRARCAGPSPDGAAASARPTLRQTVATQRDGRPALARRRVLGELRRHGADARPLRQSATPCERRDAPAIPPRRPEPRRSAAPQRCA
jgi:hypothetical protein